jgi:hypothetical protein
MKYSFRLILIVIVFFFSNVNATTHVVTNPNPDSPYWSTVPGSFTACVLAAAAGDSIIFDYSALGNSPTITLHAAYSNYGIGNVIIDGLRDIPVSSALPKFIINGTPGVNAAILTISQPNTTLRGLDFGPVGGNGLFITSSNNTIDSCYVHNSDYQGILIGFAASNVTVKNSHIYDNNVVAQTLPEHAGIYSIGPNTTIDSCFIYGNKSNGILISLATASGSKITNSIIGRDQLGNDIGNGWNGIWIWKTTNALVENNLVVNNGITGPSAVYVSGIVYEKTIGGTINNNYVGTDPFKSNSGNAFEGISLRNDVSNINVTNNISCNNGFLYSADGGGIGMRFSIQDITIASNFIGVHPDMTDGGNKNYGISVECATNVIIGGTNINEGNFIGYTKNTYTGTSLGCGIWFTRDANSGPCNSNEVYNNNIINNGGAGIQFQDDARNNIIGDSNQGNILTGNLYGILVLTSNAVQNTLRYNSFSCNTLAGISLQNGGNNEYGNASILKEILVNTAEKRNDFVSGLAPSAGATVDIYSADISCPVACDNSMNQGATWITSVTASSTPNSNGLYFWEYDFVAGGNLVNKTNVVVLATQNGNAGQVNTSEFSICANLCNVPTNSAINAIDLDLCAGENTILTANSQGKDATEGYSYNWYLGSIGLINKISYGIDDSTLTVTQAGTYSVVISSQLDSASCSDTTTTATVVVNSLPTVNITAPSNTMCEGDSVLLNAGTSGSNLSIVWTPGGLTSNSIYVKSDDTYEVVVTNTVTNCESSDNTTITTSAVPVLALSAPFFCQGEETTVDAGISGMNYAWTPSGETAQSFTVSTEETHAVTVTDPSTNCSAIGSILADQSPDPKPIVTLPIDTIMCLLQGETIEITATVVSATVGTFTWSNGTSNTATITATDTIEYFATYSDQYQCTGVDTIKIKNLCVPPDPTLPNVVTEESPWTPFDDITPEQVIESSFVVFNRWGLEVFSTEEVLPSWKGYNSKDQKCAAGVYFWVWEYTDNTNTIYKYNGFMQLLD